MPKVQYKEKTGVLHIGGGRFFHANEPVEVTAEEKEELLKSFSDLEEVAVANTTTEQTDGKFTEAALKKLNADQQKELIVELGGNTDETKNEAERIALILQLQEAKGE